MKNNNAPAAATVNRRHFLRNAATAAGAVALGAPAAAVPVDEELRIAESPASAAAWEEFQRQLALVLPDLSEDEYLVLTCKRTNQFVQFMAQGGHGMRAEAVGNEFLDSAAQLSNESVARLVAMGWHAPTYALKVKPATEEEPPDGSPNFYLDAGAPVPYGDLAALAVKTLREIYRVGHPGQLEYAAISLGDEGLSIRFPSLGLRRESRR
jgi:type III secretion system-like peptide-binding chaperone